MKLSKSILIYLGLILGVVIVAIMICFAFMYFSPGTSVLGFEYVNYSSTKEYKYTSTTDQSVSGVKALEISTEQSDIYILPNDESDEMKVIFKEGFSGFVRSINKDLTYTASVSNKSFEENTSTFKTFSIYIDEPSGWVSKKSAAIYVYVPTGLNLNTIYAQSQGGNAYYFSDHNTNILTCTNLYLKTDEDGKIEISNTQNINNYYLSTYKGSVVFKNISTLSANTVKFNTDSGTFDFTNADNDATLTLSDALVIKSQDSHIGPTVKIDKLISNLSVNANNGYYRINEIGSVGNFKIVAMTLKKAEVKLGTVHGFVSILARGNSTSNKISIFELNSDVDNNVFDSGRGDIIIETLRGDASLESTSGNVSVKNASIESNIYAYSTSGNININYTFSNQKNDLTKLSVLTKTGNILLSNISCKIDIQVLSNSIDSKLDIIFTAVSYFDNIINAKNRKINLTLKGGIDNLRCRIVSTSQLTISDGTVGSEVSTELDSENNPNDDYLLGNPLYNTFSFGYRIGYTKNSPAYADHTYDSSMGKLLISTSGKIYLNSKAA